MCRGSRPIRRFCAALSLIAATVIWFAGPGPRAQTADHADMACADCHQTADGANGLLRSRQESLCGNCHRGAVEASHPSGFAPARGLPARFPLGLDGAMTCSTCHDIHGEQPDLLRGNGSRALCLGCHDTRFFAEMADGGESLLGFGHLAARPFPADGGLDPYSTRCVDCHIDQAPTAGVTQAGLNSSNHPVARDYHSAARSGGYRDPSQLADGILLPGGQIGCVSCHLAYSRDHGGQPQTRAELCAECHEL